MPVFFDILFTGHTQVENVPKKTLVVFYSEREC
jgi:hypothetical protein